MQGFVLPPEPPSVASEKAALRSRMKHALSEITTPLRLRHEQTVLGHLSEFLLAEQQRTPQLRIALYASRGAEFSTQALDKWLARHGVMRAVPVIAGEMLRFIEVSAHERIHDFPKDRFGIPTPPSSYPEVSLSDCQGVVVPGLAFDQSGGRLGYGRGFYDRCLAETRHQQAAIWRLGIHFDVQLVEKVPVGVWDEHVDWLCSPSRGLTHRTPPGDSFVTQAKSGPPSSAK